MVFQSKIKRCYFPLLLLWTALAYTQPEESQDKPITITVKNNTYDAYWLFINGKRIDIGSTKPVLIETNQQENAFLQICKKWPGIFPYLWCLISRKGLLYTKNDKGFSVNLALPQENATISITELKLGKILVDMGEARRNTQYKLSRLL